MYTIYIFTIHLRTCLSAPPSPLPPLALALFHVLSGILQLCYIFTIHLNVLSRILQNHQAVRFLVQNAVRFDRWEKSSSAA